MAETVLVTGATGYVAGWCIADLLGRGYQVRATMRGPTSEKEQAVRAAVGGGTDRLTFVAADLTSDDGWDAAMAGCAYVLHVASPLGGGERDDLVGPARDGTLRVLRAAAAAGVRRVVMTSSTAACTPTSRAADVSGDESVWTDPDGPLVNEYRRSKILAERAAWDFMAGYAGPMTLTTVLPGAVLGPLCNRANIGSVELVQRLLNGRPPGIPRLGFCVIDVRDLADLHIRAMTAPAAAGERFIAANDFMWLSDMAATLRTRLGARAAKVPTRRMPDLVVRGLALFVPLLRTLLPVLGQRRIFSPAKARDVLGFAPRPGVTTIVDCAESLLAEIPRTIDA